MQEVAAEVPKRMQVVLVLVLVEQVAVVQVAV